MKSLRERDIGWRIDYLFVTKSLGPLIEDAFTQRETLGSDHGPYGVILDKTAEVAERPTYAKTEPSTLF